MNALRSAALMRSAFNRVAQQARAKSTTPGQAANRVKETVANPQETYRGTNPEIKKPDVTLYITSFCVGCAFIFLGSTAYHNMHHHKEVTVDPQKRVSTIQSWGKEKYPRVVERAAEIHGKPSAEGLGVDHDEWKAKKEEYMKN